MYNIEIAGMKYRYIVGPFSIGIVTPSRKRYIVPMMDILNPFLSRHPKNGSADDRLSPDEVAAYVLRCKLK